MQTQIVCPPEPQLRERLKETIQAMPEEVVDLLIDFSEVSILTGSSISKLLRLRKILEERNGQIVLCNVSPQTRDIFKTTKLEEVFKFSDD